MKKDASGMKMHRKTLRFYGPERKNETSGMKNALFPDFIYGLGKDCYIWDLRSAERIILKSD